MISLPFTRSAGRPENRVGLSMLPRTATSRSEEELNSPGSVGPHVGAMTPLIDLDRSAVGVLGDEAAAPLADLVVDQDLRAERPQRGRRVVQGLDVEADERASLRPPSRTYRFLVSRRDHRGVDISKIGRGMQNTIATVF